MPSVTRIPSKALASVTGYLDFRKSRREFLQLGGIIDATRVILSDRTATAGAVDPHYFTQDIHVARKILNAAPERHVDVGSRIDGFVSHLAVFREIDVIDLRPEPPKLDPNIRFTQGDLMCPSDDLRELTSSLSCLHTLEHLGLGRYGDKVDPNGYKTGLETLISMLRSNGTLYVSTPIGRPQVVFNAHRIFAPEEFVEVTASELDLVTFDFIDDQGRLALDANLSDARNLSYGCGIYTFTKR